MTRRARSARRRLAAATAAVTTAGLAALSGCAPYALHGAVVSGAAPSVQWVASDDPRLAEPGLASARVTAWLDPHRLSPEKIGEATTNGAGAFALPIDAAGAGVLLMKIEVRGQRPPDHGSATAELDLPQRDRRLLITLVPGPDTDPRRPGNILDQTLRDAEPFLRE